MKLALLVIGDGRLEYLTKAIRSVNEHVLHPITARCMINDEHDSLYEAMLDQSFPEFDIVHTHRQGMAGAVQAGFDLALSHDPDYVLWLEEDFVLQRPLPIREAADRLEHDPHLAQMLFQRQPLSPEEQASGSVLGGFQAWATEFSEYENYVTHNWLFSLNPCLIPNEILKLGWDTNNEAGMTEKLKAGGYRFGCWRGQYVETVGAGDRSVAWKP